MRVAVYYNNKDVRLEERTLPKIGQGELLVKVRASGICGTDTMEWYRIKKAPRVLGHEITGEIVESKSDKFNVGQRVFVSHHVECGKCKYCLEGNQTACSLLHSGNYDPGGYSEFIRVPKINVDNGTYLLPKGVSFEEGTLIEPLACAIRGLNVIGLRENQVVMIPGCGISGLLNIRLAKLRGAKVVATDIHEYRLEMAKTFGADEVMHADDVADFKADRIIVCTDSYKAVKQAFECIDKKGVILLFAIPGKNVEIPVVDFWRNEITVTSSYGAASPDLEDALNLIKEKKIDTGRLITHRLPFTDIQKGFDIVSSANESLKVVLVMES